MRTFKDSNGREWKISINVNSLKRSRDGAAFDLLKITEDRAAIFKLSEDPVTLVSVLYAVCQPQADAAAMTPEQFAEGIASGDILEAAASALLSDLIDFFPKHRREVMTKTLAKLDEYRGKAAELAIQRLDSPELNDQVAQILKKAINSPPHNVGE